MMKKTCAVVALMIMTSASASFAKSDAEATAAAIAQEACGKGLNDTIVSAEYLDDGRIQVTCARPAALPPTDTANGTVADSTGTGATVATNFVPALGGLFAVVLGAAALGGSSSTSDTK
jgi:hypothetical protein